MCCFAYSNHLRCLASHKYCQSIENGDNEMDIKTTDVDCILASIGDMSLDGDPIVDVWMVLLELAATPEEEEQDQLLLLIGEYILMYWAQRALYQERVGVGIADATAGVLFEDRHHTFVVNYRQNLELPVFNNQQLGATYYYTPLTVNNLGMVYHVHEYENGEVKEHMYAHVYHKGVGKKGAHNDVASLILKTLR